ncbi:MAG: sensor histidine kinase [Rhodoglobus sp.]
MSRLSIRARITIGSVLAAAVLLSVGLWLVRAQVNSILTGTNAVLAEGDLVSFEKDILANPDEPVDDPGTGVLVFVRAPDGERQVDTLPEFLHGVVERRDGADEQFTAQDDGESFVVVGRVVTTSAGDWSLWAARSETASQLALESLDRLLVIGGLVLLTGFGIASWLLASAALHPVRQMRERAETLGAQNSDDGLPVGPAQDELAKLATTLNEFIRRVRSSAAREKRMVSDAAHELRTPLAALRTQLELAHDDFGDAEALAAQVTAAEASVAHLSSLATNLLELSRLESSERTAGSATTRELVEQLMGSIDRARMLGLAKHADIGFELLDTDQQQHYALDPQGFGRIADNLLANAVAAIDPGGSVTATVQQTASGIVLQVSDSGHGMDETFLPRAFERFTRPDDSRSAATGGSGLGLALVKAIASAAGGTAAAENTHPGLTVSVSIPSM